MKRTGIKRSTWLNRGAYLPRRKRLPPRRSKPRTVRQEDGSRVKRVAFGEQAELCRRLPCCACDPVAFQEALSIVLTTSAYWLVSEPHHEPPRSCGGVDEDTARPETQMGPHWGDGGRGTMSDGGVTNFDRDMGKPHACLWCGYAWSVHRCGDGLCPGQHDDGSLWRGSWERSPVSTYAPAQAGEEACD